MRKAKIDLLKDLLDFLCSFGKRCVETLSSSDVLGKEEFKYFNLCWRGGRRKKKAVWNGVSSFQKAANCVESDECRHRSPTGICLFV